MSLIGNLSVKLGLDSTSFESTLKKMTSAVSSGTARIAESFRSGIGSSSVSSAAKLNTEVDKLQGSMNTLVSTTQRTANAMSKALSSIVIPPSSIIPMNGVIPAGATAALIKHISQITDYIIILKQMGMITESVATKLTGFSTRLYSMGLSVDYITSKIREMLSAFGQTQTRANAATSALLRLQNATRQVADASANSIQLRIAAPTSTTSGVNTSASSSAAAAAERAAATEAEMAARTTSSAYATMSGRIRSALATAASAVRVFGTGVRTSLSSANAATTSFGNYMSSMCRRVAASEDTLFRGSNSGFKDMARVMQGIILAQGFYKFIGMIQDATSALANFSAASEQSTAAFSIIFGDTSKAERFMYMVQDFAAKTPFTMQQAADSARKLLAYGFDPSTIQPVMNILSDAASLSGDPETFERVGKAIGQIQTKGHLAAQELLQLTEAGIPAFQILQDKLHLTSAQMSNIGKQGIPASVAIQAILKGMQEKYGGASAAMSETVGGMLNTIKDNALLIGRDAFGGFFTSFETVVRKIRNEADKLRTIITMKGFGGMMQNLIPADILPSIQLLVANIEILWQTVKNLFMVWVPVWQVMGQLLVNVLNVVIPMLYIFIQVIAWMVGYVTQSSQAVRVLVGVFFGIIVAAWAANLLITFVSVVKELFIVRIATQFILYLARALVVLGGAMLTNPWLAGMAIATGVILYFGLTCKTVQGWIQGFGSSLAGLFGKSPTKVFTPAIKAASPVTNEFNHKLALTSSNLKSVSTAAAGTGKKIKATRVAVDKTNKSLSSTAKKLTTTTKAAKKTGDTLKKAGKDALQAVMAFDEVFNIENPDADKLDPNANTIPTDTKVPDVKTPKTPDVKTPSTPDVPVVGTPDTSYPDPGAIDPVGDAVPTIPDYQVPTPKLPDMGSPIQKWIEKMKKSFGERLRDAGIGMVIGAALGAIIGGLLGGPAGAILGAKIGAVIGALVGWFWQDIVKLFSSTSGRGAFVGGAIGTTLGFALFGPLGAIMGMILGSVLGALVEKFWPTIKKAFKNDDKKAGQAGIVIGALVGFLIAGPIGAAIGSALGLAIALMVKKFWPDIKKAFKENNQGATTGAMIGGTLGFAFAGPLGAAIGAALGAAIGILVQKFWPNIKKEFAKLSSTGVLTGMSIGAILGFLIAGPIGAGIGAALVLAISQLCPNFWKDLKAGFMKPVNSFLGDIKKIFAPMSTTFGTLFKGDANIFSIGGNIIWGIMEGIAGAVLTIGAVLYRFLIQPIVEGIKKLFGIHSPSTVMMPIGDFLVQGIWEGLKGAMAGFLANIWGVGASIFAAFGSWLNNTKAGALKWCGDVKKSFDGWWSGTKTGFNTWATDTGKKLSTWWTTHKAGFSTWTTDTKKKLSTWWSDTKTGFSTWSTNTNKNLSTWWSGTKAGFSTWGTNTKKNLGTWWSDTKSGFNTWSTTTNKKLSSWWSGTKSGFNTWASDNKKKLSTWWSDTKSGFNSWSSDTNKKISSWWSSTKSGFSTWSSNTKSNLNTWWSNTKSGFGSWSSDTHGKFNTWWSSTKTGFSTWNNNTKATISGWWANTKSGFSTWGSTTKGNFSTWWSSTKTSWSGWSTNTRATFNTWGIDSKKKIADAVAGMKKTFKDFTGLDLGKGMIGGVIKGMSSKMDELKKGVKNIVDTVTKKFTDLFQIRSPSHVMQGIGGYVTSGLIKGMSAKNIGEHAASIISGMKGKFSEIKDFFNGVGPSFSGGGMTAGVIGQIREAMTMLHIPMQYLPGLETIAKNESSGNVRSINLWDSNAKAGHPSRGLFQTIPSTFARFKVAGHNNIYNGLDNSLAAIKYMIATYGGINNVPGLKAVRSGRKYQGYARGSMNTPEGPAYLHENGPELTWMNKGTGVLNNPNTMALLHVPEILAKFTTAIKANLTTPKTAAINTSGIMSKATVNEIAGLRQTQTTGTSVTAEAVVAGLQSTLAPLIANLNVTKTSAPTPVDDRPILYVGNLIADNRGLKELDRKMRVIRLQEDQRRGI